MTTSKAELFNALNTQFAPPTEFGDQTLTLDLPSEATGDGYNSKLTIHGIPGRGYYGAVDVFYQRIPLSSLGATVELHKQGTFVLDDILAGLNGLAGAFLSAEDLQTFTIPTLAVGESKTVTISAHPNSLGWAGDLTLTLTYGKPQLSAVVGNRNLNTLYHGNGKRDLPSAWAMVYYMDFTSYRDALAIDPVTKRYTDEATVLDIIARLGLPGWAVQGAQDLPTSSVPNANTAFDRVVVQNIIYSYGMYGPFFFHYNTTKFDGG